MNALPVWSSRAHVQDSVTLGTAGASPGRSGSAGYLNGIDVRTRSRGVRRWPGRALSVLAGNRIWWPAWSHSGRCWWCRPC